MTDEEIRAKLLAMRAEIEGLMASVDADSASVALDQTQQGRLSRMDAMQQQAMAEETRRRRQRDIQLINAALSRLEDGEYGYCVTCGEAVEPERLALDAATPFCIGHAR
ncbi:MAG: TraR/DksA family transcriptional regulator [Parvibaculales bacterium]